MEQIFSLPLDALRKICYTHTCMRFFSALLFSAILLSSCAYMQTHKNIREAPLSYSGYHMTRSPELYQAGNKWYIGVESRTLRKEYPVIHDEVLLKRNNAPRWVEMETEQSSGMIYHEISRGTALVLQRKDGFATTYDLAGEIDDSGHKWCSTLPAGAIRRGVQAEIIGSDTNLPTKLLPEQGVPTGIRILSWADKVLIDYPGTVLYNVAIPFMAPFIFFYEFLHED